MKTGKHTLETSARIKSEIFKGQFKNNSYLPCQRDLAIEHNVSRTTIRRALEILETEGYLKARSRKGYQILPRAYDPNLGCPVAYLLSEENIIRNWDFLYKAIKEFLENSIEEKGWSLATIIESRHRTEQFFKQIKDMRCCGLIVNSVYKEVVEQAKKFQLPIVAIDCWDPEQGIDTIVQDNFAGAQLAVASLIEQGHKRIAWFGASLDTYHSRSRYGSSLAALAENNLSFTESSFKSLNAPDLLDTAKVMLKKRGGATAFLTFWKPMADAIIIASRELGLKQEKDFSMVGWCATEVWEKGYKPIFRDEALPPMIHWSAKEMVDLALNSLERQRMDNRLPSIKSNISVKLVHNKETQNASKNIN